MTLKISPLYTEPENLAVEIQKSGYAVLNAVQAWSFLGIAAEDAMTWSSDWNDLPIDTYLKDGGRYRRRRHSCFVVDGLRVRQAPHRPHWQPLQYNALHGGMQRMFEPMSAKVAHSPDWVTMLRKLGGLCTSLKPATTTWFVEAHQFRIDTTDGIGRPTPEGAHRDGVDFVAVILIARENIKGGETRVFDINGSAGQRFTMTDPWTMLLLDDERVIHESTPIQPIDAAGSQLCYRDTLVITFRAKAFQGE